MQGEAQLVAEAALFRLGTLWAGCFTRLVLSYRSIGIDQRNTGDCEHASHTLVSHTWYFEVIYLTMYLEVQSRLVSLQDCDTGRVGGAVGYEGVTIRTVSRFSCKEGQRTRKAVVPPVVCDACLPLFRSWWPQSSSSLFLGGGALARTLVAPDYNAWAEPKHSSSVFDANRRASIKN